MTPRLSTVLSRDSHRKVATTVNQLIDTTSNYPGLQSVKGFGAKGDGITDDTASIQAAVDAINAAGGGALYFPAGQYLISSYITLCQNLRIVGEGQLTSKIVTALAGGGGATADENVRNGTALYSNWPSNSSTSARIVIEHIGISCSNAANVGAGFYDNCGSRITLRNVAIGGFKYGVIFDQTELADIHDSELSAANNSGACLWIVNGATLRAGNSPGFSNRIGVHSCDFNAGATVYGILDDGGNVHVVADCNFNACLNHIRAAGVFPLDIRGGEFESAASHCVVLSGLTSAGDAAGGNFTAVYGGLYAATGGNASIHGQDGPGGLSVSGIPEFSGGAGTNAITGGGGFSGLWLLSYANQTTAIPLSDDRGAFHYDPSEAIEIAAGDAITFDSSGGAGHEGYIERDASSPYDILRLGSKGGTGGWKGAVHVSVSYNGGTEFDGFKVRATGATDCYADVTTGFSVGGTQVVGAQQSAIANDASGAANQATVNAILAALRTHGLIAT